MEFATSIFCYFHNSDGVFLYFRSIVLPLSALLIYFSEANTMNFTFNCSHVKIWLLLPVLIPLISNALTIAQSTVYKFDILR